MKKKTIKKVFVVFGYIATFCLIWLYVGFVLTPKSYNDTGGDYYFAYKSIFNEEKNSIDVMFSGNSNTFKSCIPIEFYNQTGYTCYNIGGSVQSAQAMEARIKSVLKNQLPNLIIFDVDCLYSPNIFYTGSNKYSLLSLIAPVFYHNRWQEFEISDLYKIPYDDKNFMKGYVALTQTSNYQIPQTYMKKVTQKIEPLESSVKDNMQNIYNICKKNDIKMLFISVPSPATWTNEKHNGIAELANQFGVEYLDLNMPDVEFGFDYAKHIADEGFHCNHEGAKLVTTYISQYVKDNYDFPKTCSSELSKHWDNQYIEYKNYENTILKGN